MDFPKTIKVVYDRNGCIGAQACVAINPIDWVMNQDGKADLTEGKKEGDRFVKVIQVDDQQTLNRLVESANVCPVNIIEVWDIAEYKKLAPQ